jgi:hypothetical protein
MDIISISDCQQGHHVQESGALDGVLLRVDHDRVYLKKHDGAVQICEASHEVTASLSPAQLGNSIRLTGQGEWQRTQDGSWQLQRFQTTAWENLSNLPLNEIFQTMRNARGNEWNDLEDPIKEHLRIRSME